MLIYPVNMIYLGIECFFKYKIFFIVSIKFLYLLKVTINWGKRGLLSNIFHKLKIFYCKYIKMPWTKLKIILNIVKLFDSKINLWWKRVYKILQWKAWKFVLCLFLKNCFWRQFGQNFISFFVWNIIDWNINSISYFLFLTPQISENSQ